MHRFTRQDRYLLNVRKNNGYWQIEIDEAGRDKTAFTSHHNLFRFIRKPFGLHNAPGIFQQNDGRHSLVRAMAACTCLLGRNCYIIGNLAKAHRTRPQSLSASLRSKSNTVVPRYGDVR